MRKIAICFITNFFLLPDAILGKTVKSRVAGPWIEGQVIAESDISSNNVVFNYPVYRILLKKLPEGFLVQELYKNSNKKATDPFVIEKIEDISRIPYAYYSWPVSPISITGVYTVWYENGVIMQQGHYLNGKKDGLWRRWYSNGQKHSEGLFKDGQLDGLWKVWNVDGSNMNESFYKNGRLEAILSNVNEEQSNSIKKSSTDDETANINVWLEWDENGRLRSQVMLVDGKKEGAWVSWDDGGKREMFGYYKDNKRDGIWKTFWLDGAETKRSEGYYKGGKKVGFWCFWDKQGNKLREEYYENGRLKKRVNFEHK